MRVSRTFLVTLLATAFAFSLAPTAMASKAPPFVVARTAGRPPVVWSTGRVTHRPRATITPAATETIVGRFAKFKVDLNPLPADARPAMRFALRQVAEVVVSDIPIVIKLTWEDLPGNLAGATGAQTHALTDNSTGKTFWYPAALANNLVGQDIKPGIEEFFMKFDSGAPWYFGTDKGADVGEIDFVSVVKHEVQHGLGIAKTFNVTGSTGSWGFDSDPNKYPVIFERFVQNGAGQVLVDSFSNSSTQLGAQLTGEDLFFGGATAKVANGGQKPELYAPSTWEPASSVTHLADSFAGTKNEMMTRSYLRAFHDIGPVIRGMLADLGYFVAHVRKLTLEASKHVKLSGLIKAPFAWAGCVNHVSVVIQHLKNGKWSKVDSVKTDGDGKYKLEVPDVPGRYRAQVPRKFVGPTGSNLCVKAVSKEVTHHH